MAMGFVLAPGTYLRDGWNIVDFCVVVLGFVDIFTSGNLTALRTVRVLRPLRAVTRIRGMRVLVETMIESMPMLIDVFILCAFTFFIFGLVAVQLFAGALRYRCGTPVFDGAYAAPDGSEWLEDVAYEVVDDSTTCSGPMDTRWSNATGTPVAYPGPRGGGFVCPEETYCFKWGNPNYGMTSHDHILWAWLTIFQSITQEGWSDVMYYTQDAITWWVWPFYVALVVFGSFYIINLALAVLFLQFSTDNHQDDKDTAAAAVAAAAERRRRASDESGGDDSDCDVGPPGGGLRGQPAISSGALNPSPTISTSGLPAEEVAALGPLRRGLHRVAVSKWLEYTTAALIIANTIVMCINWYGMPHSVERATNYVNYALTVYFLIELVVKLTAFGFKRYFSDGMNCFDALVVAISVTEMVMDIIPSVSGLGPLSVLRAFRLLRIFRLARSWKELHMIIKAMFKSVASTAYLSLLMLLFMFIAALMGMQLFGYKFMFCDYVEGARPVCPLGQRVWGDCPDHFYCYLPCAEDQAGGLVDAPGSRFNDVAVCERFCASDQAAQAAEAGQGPEAVAAAGGCEYLAMVGKSEVPRAHFDTVAWGLYTVFQLLTTENWNNVMYDGMRTVSPWAAIYFVVVMLIGTYLVFNLFIAILLDNFAGTFTNAAAAADGDASSAGGNGKRRSSDSGSDSSADSYDSMQSEAAAFERGRKGSDDGDGPGDEEEDDGNLGSGHLHPLRVSASARAGGDGHLARPQDVGVPPAVPRDIPKEQANGHSDSAADMRVGLQLGLGLVKGAGAKVVPVDMAGRPVSALAGSRPKSSRPKTARPMSPQGVTFAADTATRRSSFLAAHGGVAGGDEGSGLGGKGGRGLGASLQRSLQRMASSIRSIRNVRHNEHLAKSMRGRSLLLFGPDHWVRWRAARLVHNTHFEKVVLLLILASSVTLALDTPSLDPGSRLGQALRYMDYVFTGAFAVEALLKIVTFGFLFTGRHAYLRNGWNVLDFLIVLVGFALIAVEATGASQNDIKMLRVLRTLRALRPLRAASRFEGLKVVVNALFAVLPSMLNVALVCLLFYIIFAILAVSLWKGRMYSCVEAGSGERLDAFYVLPPGGAIDRAWCDQGTVNVTASDYYTARNISLPAYEIATEWVNPHTNYDNVGIAMLTLFQVASLELWVDIMFMAVDATGINKQPVWNHNPIVILFFVVFIIIGAFFVLNLFIGVTLDKFAELQQAAQARSLFVTEQQSTWVDVQKMLLRTSMQLRPPRPEEQPARERLYDFVMSSAFDGFVVTTIVVNMLFMAMVHADMSPAWQNCMTYSNLIFTIIFLVEAVLKLAAFGLLPYFRDPWNSFDFFVVLISIASVALDFSNMENLSFMPVLRVLRVVRVFRLIRRAQGLQRLLVTLMQSLPALANVGGVMLLFFFIYAIIGMNLFGSIKHGDFLNRQANFENFPNAMLVLMRMVTGESWDGIMQDCMVTKGCVLLTAPATSPATNASLPAGDYFDPGDPLIAGLPPALLDDECSLSPFAAVVYFPTFVIICGFVLLNLVIAVILENMIVSETDEGLPVTKTMVRQLVEAWSTVDPAASGVAHAAQLPVVVMGVDPPMGTRGEPNARAATQAVIMSVDIPVRDNNTVTFIETLHALSGRIAGTELPEIEEDWLVERLCRRLPAEKRTGSGGGTAAASFPKYTAAHFHAALYVQAAVRGFMARHRIRQMAGGEALEVGAGAGTGTGAAEGQREAQGGEAERGVGDK